MSGSRTSRRSPRRVEAWAGSDPRPAWTRSEPRGETPEGQYPTGQRLDTLDEQRASPDGAGSRPSEIATTSAVLSR